MDPAFVDSYDEASNIVTVTYYDRRGEVQKRINVEDIEAANSYGEPDSPQYVQTLTAIKERKSDSKNP